MYKNYYIFTRPGLTGIHMIHSEDCPFISQKNQKILLGRFSSATYARETGKLFFRKSSLCPFCSKQENLYSAEETFMGVSYKNLVPSWDSAFICGTN